MELYLWKGARKILFWLEIIGASISNDNSEEEYFCSSVTVNNLDSENFNKMRLRGLCAIV